MMVEHLTMEHVIVGATGVGYLIVGVLQWIKGDSPRKQQDQKAYEEGWDRIFSPNKNRKKAIEFVATFYKVTQEEVKELFMDEVEAYERLLEKGIEND